MLRLTTYTAATDFLRDVDAYLERQEAVTDLMLGLAGRLAEDPSAYGSSPPYFAAVADEQGPVVAALMTPPHNLILHSEMAGMPGPLELLAQDLIAGHWTVAGVIGPVHLSEAFAGLWACLTGTVGRPGISQRIYKLTEVIHPRYAPGSLRPALGDDAGLVVRWMEAFQREAAPGGPQLPPDMAHTRIAERNVFLWDESGPASMAVKTRPTRHGVSVSWVYTPPELRRRGYATSCVAALSQQLLDAGFQYCTLFTDLSNPTSNDIYQQIGYRPVCDFREIKFAPG